MAEAEVATKNEDLFSLDPAHDLWATMAPWGLGKHPVAAWIWQKDGDDWQYVGRAWQTSAESWEGEFVTGRLPAIPGIRGAIHKYDPLPTTYRTLQSAGRAMAQQLVTA